MAGFSALDQREGKEELTEKKGKEFRIKLTENLFNLLGNVLLIFFPRQ